jgi:hypothetical protein
MLCLGTVSQRMKGAILARCNLLGCKPESMEQRYRVLDGCADLEAFVVSTVHVRIVMHGGRSVGYLVSCPNIGACQCVFQLKETVI